MLYEGLMLLNSQLKSLLTELLTLSTVDKSRAISARIQHYAIITGADAQGFSD
jgi:hypothetical protein